MPFGLYDGSLCPWAFGTLPQSPTAHLFCLRALIGKICHVYLDDIIIWSASYNSMKAYPSRTRRLRLPNLYCSVKKSMLSSHEVDFLGHHVSVCGNQTGSAESE